MKKIIGFVVLLSMVHLISCVPEDDPEKFTVYQDFDGDGYGNPEASKEVTKETDGYVTDDTDCDDTDPNINPDAMEIPDNEVDENCDSLMSATWYSDADADGYGNPSIFLIADTQPVGYVSNGSDCNDDDENIYPDAIEIPDNDVDENCDTIKTYTWYQDLDGDGYGNDGVSQVAENQPSNYVSNNEDCNDGNPNIHPGANEIKGNGVDEDCDGTAQEAICGDGVVDIGEGCDDGNLVNGDGCNNVCAIESAVCGNATVEAGEGCDDGNIASGDGCSQVCTVETDWVCTGSPSVCTVL